MPVASRSKTSSKHRRKDLRHELTRCQAALDGCEQIFLSPRADCSDIVLLTSRSLAVLYASPSCQPITGYHPREIIGRCCLDFVHPDDAAQAASDFFSRLQEGPGEVSREFRLVRKSGAPVMIEAAGRAVEPCSGDSGIMLHYRESSRQKLSVHCLFEQKKLYETILNAIYDGVCITDKNNAITFVNRGFATTLGMPAEAVIGKKIFPDILSTATQFFQHHYRTAGSSLEPSRFDSILVTTAADISIVLSGWCIPLPANGAFDGMICTFTNCTEHHLTKEKLSESEIRFRSIAETATDGIITVNGAGCVVFWNTAATEIFGFDEKEVLGREIFQIMPVEVMSDHARIFAEPEESLVHPSVGKTVEGTACRKDGTHFPIELSLASWMTAGEVFFTAIIRDITVRKRIEQSLYNSEQELKALSSRLLNAHELERKRIAYELHDGLGQILSAAMIGAKSLISAETPLRGPAPPDSLPAHIQAAIEEVRRISRDLRPSILDDLGIIAAIDAFCRDFEQLHRTITLRKAISCREHEIPAHLKIVVYRIIQEACTNVVRHSAAGTLTLRLTNQTGPIVLSISDNGAGFDVHTAYAAHGRGLGLSSMRERVEYSGGRFHLESGPGRGTTVQASWDRPVVPEGAIGP